MACCKYCSFNDSPEPNVYLGMSEYERGKVSLRREMAQIKADDIAQNELIEELQKRVSELQAAMLKVLTWVDNKCSHCGYAPSGGSGGAAEKPKIIQRLTPFELYRAYLVGDYENDTENKGYQSDEDIDGRVDVKPAAMRTPKDYLPPSAGEDDRLEDRKKVKWMFIGVGSESGSSQSELSEYEEMLNDPNPDIVRLATERLKTLYSQGVTDRDDASSDTEE